MAKNEILVLHHIEPEWESSFDGAYLARVRKHVATAQYKRVIVSTLEGLRVSDLSRCSEEYGGEFFAIGHALQWHRVQEVEWTYAWEDYYNDPEFKDDIIQFSGGHGDAYLYDWIKQLKGERVVVCGGHSEECLYDLLESFRHLDINHRVLYPLVY